MRYAIILLILISTISAFANAHSYVVVANDQKFSNINGINRIEKNPRVGSLTILDFKSFPPGKCDIQNVPCSLIGPPTSIAITKDQKYVIVSVSMKLDPNDNSRQIPDNRISIVDIEKKKVSKTILVGNQPSGVVITPDGKKILVCNRGDGSIDVISIDGNNFFKETTVMICKPEDSLSHFAISSDGTYGLGSLHNSAKIIKVGLREGIPQTVEAKITVGRGPYSIDFVPDSNMAVVANALDSTISIINGKYDEIIDTIYVGPFVEGLDISPDGKWLAVNCMMYTMNSPDDPLRQEYGQLILLKKTNKSFSIIQRIPIDRIPQSAIFTYDSRYVVVAGYEHKRLRIYHLVNELLEDTGIVFMTPGRPCALRIAN